MSWRTFVAVLTVLAPVAAAPTPGAGAAAAAVPKSGAEKGAAEGGPTASAFLRVPLFDESFASFPAARVEDDVITLRDLNEALAGAHGAHGEGKAGKTDVGPILDRLVDVRLLVMEARNMGFGDLPETKAAVAEFEESAAMELLKDRVTEGIGPDPEEVKRQYEEAVRQWKVRSVLFADESDAIRLRAAVEAGGKFGDLAAAALAEKKAKGGVEPQVLPRAKVLPHVAAALEGLAPGRVSSPLKVQDGWTLLEVEEVLYPDDPKARAEAEKDSAKRRKVKALDEYYRGMVKRHARIDRKLLASVDLEAKKPGLEALRKDKRVLARIKGAKPITVGDLANAVAEGLFHRLEGVQARQRINLKKPDIFDGLLSKRIIPLEVKRLGIGKSPELERRVAEHERSLLFGRIVQQVIAPQIQVTEEAAKQYYEKNAKEFTYPAFYKLESLAFSSRKPAESAVEKLRSGTDFKWLNANADGQIEPSARSVRLEGTISAGSMPPALAELLAGARAGDYRLFAHASSQFYAIHVIEVVPPRTRPFEEVKDAIGDKLFYEELNAAVREWAGKLRKASDVEVYVTRVDI